MSSLGFLCILRDSGDAAYDLCGDIAAVAEPGDEVILLDDSGPGVGFHTSAVAARFGAMEGWPAGVSVRLISTGVRGEGDEGTATALALAEARAGHLIVLPGRARLNPAGFAAARRLVAGADLVVGAVEAPGLIAPDTPSAHLGRLIFRRDLAFGLSCVQGGAGGGTLPLVLGLLARAAVVRPAPAVMAGLPPLAEVTPDWLDVWGRSRAAPVAMAFLAEQQAGAGVGARLVMKAALTGMGLPEAAAAVTRVALPAPPATGRARIKVACEGPHAHRMPLAYPALADLWGETAEITAEPEKADLILFAHLRDLSEMRVAAARAIEAQPDRPVALLSEEPFWDTLFSPDPLAGRIEMHAAHLGPIRLHQRNHHNSSIYDFDRLPYFLLTEEHYASRYAEMFARNARLSAEDWEAAFQARTRPLVFMAERRPEPFHDLRHPGGDVLGLCAWRTRLAGAAYPEVSRMGASWGEEVPSRLALEDWHADKIARLDGTVAVLSALENTHQPTYLSEKLFDAFACGARPLYMGSPAHRLHGLDLPAESWVNLWGLTSEAAAARIGALTWDKAFYRAYAAAQKCLAALWTDPEIRSAERARLGRALRAELVSLAEAGPA